MSHLFVISATAGLVSVLAYFRVKGKTHVVLYHAKFSGMALAIGALASLSWPLMLLRGRSTNYVFYCLTPFLQYAKHVVGMTWVLNQEKAVLEQRLVPGSVIVVNHQSALDAFGVVQLWKQLGRWSTAPLRYNLSHMYFYIDFLGTCYTILTTMYC